MVALRRILKSFALYLGLTVMVFNLASSAVSYALSADQKNILDRKIYYLDAGCNVTESNSGTAKPGDGEPDGATFPNLSPDAMASAIDKYIEKTNSTSKLNGLGETIVAGAEKSNVSPFLIVAIAQKESGLANPSDYNVRNANNAFGRTATSSQPNFQGAKLWYKWTSVKASVDYTASENKGASGGGDVAAYLRKQYAQYLDKGDIASFFKKYAPEFENDTQKYINDVGKGIDEMVRIAKEGGGGDTEPDTQSDSADENTSSGGCACPGAAGDNQSSGKNGTDIFNFYVNNGYTPEQAAGFAGNYWQESKWNPTVVNGLGAIGIAQWLDRRPALESYAKGKGDVKSLQTQLDFSLFELKGSESTANRAIKAVDGSGASAVEQVTVVIRVKYERPGGAEANDAARIEKAIEVYEKSKGGASVDSESGAGTADCGGSTASGTGETTGDFIWPLPKSAPVTTCYDYSRGRLHAGLDIAAPRGTKLVASDGGTVEMARNTDPGGYGKAVIIKHDDGKWTLYGHMDSVSVRQGDNVAQGDKIGEVGNTGRSFGDHVHFNIQTKGGEQSSKDTTLNPLEILPKDGRTLQGEGCPRKTA